MSYNKNKNNPHEGSKDALRSENAGNKAEFIKIAKQQSIKDSKLALKELKKGIFASTLNARETGKGISGDRKSLIHEQVIDRFDQQLKIYNKQHALEIDKLIQSGMKWEDLVVKIDELNKKHKRYVMGLKQAIVYAFRALAGTNKKIEGHEYAIFQSLLTNIIDGYSKNRDLRKIIVNIEQKNIQKEDWDVICDYLAKYELNKSVSRDKDQINFNITALLFRLMDQNQRFQAVLEYAKRSNNQAGERFAESLVKTDVINIKQYEELMKRLGNKKFVLSEQKESEIKLAQLQVRKIQEHVRKKLASPMFINGAERVLNRRTLGGAIITGIGVLTMISNYMAHFNTAKGMGKFVAGFKSPYFWFGALATATGTHITGKAMTAGKHGVGLFDRIIPQPKRLNNPFGVDNDAKLKDRYFNDLVDICKEHRILERWLLYNNGFNDLNGFYRSKNSDLAKIQTEALEPESIKKNNKPIIEQFMDYQIRSGNKKGAEMIKQSIRAYGKKPTENYIVKLIAIGLKIGIPTTRSFHKVKVRGQNFTPYQLLLHRQGVKTIPADDLPEARIAAATSKKNTNNKKK